jgi:hypothetical protein
MFATSTSIISPQKLDGHFPLVQAEFLSHKLPAAASAVAQSNEWLAIALDHEIILHRFKQMVWERPHRTLRIGFIPQHLLMGGIDDRYIITINTDGHYEVYDRVNLETVQHGKFAYHDADSQYQIVCQQYLLITTGRNLCLYSVGALTQPVAQFTVRGKVCATSVQQSSLTFYCVSQEADTMYITPIQILGGIKRRLLPSAYAMQFVSLSSAGDHLLLQALTSDGQLRLMTYNLPDLQLVDQQEKSLAYQGQSCLHPSQSWAATDLGNGLLIWDTQTFDPIALLQFPPPLAIIALSWLDSGQLLFVHGDTVELWSFRPTETPFLNAYHSLTIKALQDFQHWVNLQRSTSGVSYLVGEASIGKTAIVRAFTKYNFASTLYLVVPEVAEVEIKTVLKPYLNGGYRQIFLDQAENLSLDLIIELHQIAQQEGISIVLVTHYTLHDRVPVYQFSPIEESVDFQNVSAYFGPREGRHLHYLYQIKPILEASARRRTIQISK